MKSNQQSESLNSCLHLHLDGEMTLMDMILHYENAVVRIRENEVWDAAQQTNVTWAAQSALLTSTYLKTATETAAQKMRRIILKESKKVLESAK